MDAVVFGLIGFAMWLVISFLVATMLFAFRPDPSAWIMSGLSLLLGVAIPLAAMDPAPPFHRDQTRTQRQGEWVGPHNTLGPRPGLFRREAWPVSPIAPA